MAGIISGARPIIRIPANFYWSSITRFLEPRGEVVLWPLLRKRISARSSNVMLLIWAAVSMFLIWLTHGMLIFAGFLLVILLLIEQQAILRPAIHFAADDTSILHAEETRVAPIPASDIFETFRAASRIAGYTVFVEFAITWVQSSIYLSWAGDPFGRGTFFSLRLSLLFQAAVAILAVQFAYWGTLNSPRRRHAYAACVYVGIPVLIVSVSLLFWSISWLGYLLAISIALMAAAHQRDKFLTQTAPRLAGELK